MAQARGLDAHDPAVLDAVGRELGRPTTPFCAAPPLVVACFGRLGESLDTAWTRWFAVHAACGVLAVLALARVAALGGLSAAAALAVGLGVVALGDGVWMSLAMNSTNLVTLAALSLALLAAVRGRGWTEGLLLAVAVLAKTSPALVVVAALLAGRRTPVLAALVGLVALSVLGVGLVGWDVHVSWWQRVLPALGYAPELPPGHFDNGLHQWNLAPHGLFARAAAVGDLPRTLVALGAWLVSALVVLQLALGCRRPPSERVEAAADATPGAEGSSRVGGSSGPRAPAPLGGARVVRARCREYGLAVSASLLVSSVTWPHHLVLAAVPAVLLFVDRGAWRRPAAWVALAALLLLAQPLGTWGAEGEQPPDVLAYAGACLALFAALAAWPRADVAADGPRVARS